MGLLYHKKIKDKEHFIYDNEQEFRIYHKDTKLVSIWRNAKEGDWCKSDDGQVLQVIRRKNLKRAKYKDAEYVRTLLGTYLCSGNKNMQGSPPKNMYSFSGNKSHREIRERDRDPTYWERMFAQYVVQGIDPVEAYLKAFPTKDKRYATLCARTLIKQDRVQTLIRKEIQEAMSSIGITQEEILSKIWAIATSDKEDETSNARVRCLELLAKMTDMMPSSEKRSETLTVFQGFTPDQLKTLSGGSNKIIGQLEAQIDNE